MASRRIRRRRPRRTRRTRRGGGPIDKVLHYFGKNPSHNIVRQDTQPYQGSCPEGYMNCPYCGAPCKFKGDNLTTPYWTGKCEVCGREQHA
jgi:hypothetical protein